jgi:hypothetical protein
MVSAMPKNRAEGPTALPKAGAKPEGRSDPSIALLLFVFTVFRPKNACQAPKPPNPLPVNNICLSHQFHPNPYTGYRNQK